jgi:TPR repeat protein
MKRVEANDPVALCQVGDKRRSDAVRDYNGAFEYYTKAAEFGDMKAHKELALLYWTGLGVEKDRKKSVHHMELAVIGGNLQPRHNLAHAELIQVTSLKDRPKVGHQDSMKQLLPLYKHDHITKEDLCMTDTI